METECVSYRLFSTFLPEPDHIITLYYNAEKFGRVTKILLQRNIMCKICISVTFINYPSNFIHRIITRLHYAIGFRTVRKQNL